MIRRNRSQMGYGRGRPHRIILYIIQNSIKAFSNVMRSISTIMPSKRGSLKTYINQTEIINAIPEFWRVTSKTPRATFPFFNLKDAIIIPSPQQK